ncbi:MULTISPECIES: DUF1003 domain-containing protein [unclassified Enterococcus]|jgi:uncharacterized membrane protein|uniref:DUF1003 domain-containing protein n=1 Tax=unclassified Enterococcus TaxID=2608891 RepID=UPI003D2C4B40
MEGRQKENRIDLNEVEPKIRKYLLDKNPELNEDSTISFVELLNYRLEYLQEQILQEQDETKKINQEMIEKIKENKIISTNLNSSFEGKKTLGQKAADAIAKFGGSWPFIFIFICVLIIWILLNSMTDWFQPFDKYPFILLNLALSCLAAIQAPIIMMSQNRQAARDRKEADNDYRTNLKAELEISLLHEKIDYLMSEQWQHIVELQQLQIELLTQLHEQITPQEETKN